MSTDAAQAFAGQISYGASKAAVETYTRSTAMEVGLLGITVNAVAPGPVQTGYITAELGSELLPDIPMRRLGLPEDIADVIVFLASDQARWVTGQVIKVSGGHATRTSRIDLAPEASFGPGIESFPFRAPVDATDRTPVEIPRSSR